MAFVSHYSLTTILSFDIQDDEVPPERKVILMGATNNIYVSLDNIFITATKRMSYVEMEEIKMDVVYEQILPDSVLHDIGRVKRSNLQRWEKVNEFNCIIRDYSQNLTDDEEETYPAIMSTPSAVGGFGNGVLLGMDLQTLQVALDQLLQRGGFLDPLTLIAKELPGFLTGGPGRLPNALPVLVFVVNVIAISPDVDATHQKHSGGQRWHTLSQLGVFSGSEGNP